MPVVIRKNRSLIAVGLQAQPSGHEFSRTFIEVAVEYTQSFENIDVRDGSWPLAFGVSYKYPD